MSGSSRRITRRVGIIAGSILLLAACGNDYADRPLDDVVAELRDEGAEVILAWQASDSVAPRTVLDATELSDGRVRILVSSGALIAVPDVAEAPEAQARSSLEAAGLAVRLRAEPERSGPFGVVVRSDPAPDELLDPGATVTLFIREEARNRLDVTLQLLVENDQLAGETLPTDAGEDSEDWTARGPSFAGERCWGDGFYSDVRDAAQFVVRDADGTIVAKGELGSGRAVYTGDPDPDLAVDTAWACVFRFGIRDVPFSEFYEIETSRNTLTYSFDELEALGWRLDLTLGDESPIGIEEADPSVA